MLRFDEISRVDPEVHAAIVDETARQTEKIELIASENFVSKAVLEAAGTPLTNKYAEGYPGKRYYGGCEHVDVVETLAIERAKQLFGAEHANVQPHSGAQANMAVFFAMLQPGDTFMGMNLAHGGHLSHGMHLNMSLSNGKKNAFASSTDKNGLSPIAYHFIAGIMKHIKGITAVTNPLVNSYKRLVPEYEAPVYIAWSAHNRSPLIRVPAADEHAARVELRSPDPSANPYLSLALVLAAGLEGIREKIEPPAPVDGNIYEMSPAERKRKRVESLPGDLREAIEEMKKDKLIHAVLGKHIFEKYVEAKELEWLEYKTKVSQWEIDNYLSKY